jgi:hypothetical protein
MRKCVVLVLIADSVTSSWAAEKRSKNIILFIGDAGEIPIIHAAAADKSQPQSGSAPRTRARKCWWRHQVPEPRT